MPRQHHLLILIILKILILTRKWDAVCPLRLCWPHAGRAHTFGIAPKVCKNARPLQCNSIGRYAMLAIEPEPEQKGCFSYKDSEKRTPFCSFAVDRPGCIVLCLSVAPTRSGLILLTSEWFKKCWILMFHNSIHLTFHLQLTTNNLQLTTNN